MNYAANLDNNQKWTIRGVWGRRNLVQIQMKNLNLVNINVLQVHKPFFSFQLEACNYQGVLKKRYVALAVGFVLMGLQASGRKHVL